MNGKFLMTMILILTAAAAQAATLTVTKTADTNDGLCNAADCSLREAIAAAASGDSIGFDQTAFAGTQTIDLTIGELFVNKHLTVEGTGAARLTVRRSASAATNFRIVNVNFGSVLNLSKLTVSGGVSAAHGGGILINASGRLNLSNAVVRGNSTAQYGGGIHNNYGTVNITDSSLLQNSASIGGGLCSAQAAGQTVISNSTIKDNTVSAGGGGIEFMGGASFSVTNSTIDSNIVNGASNGGAGIGTNSVTGTIGNSVISRNKCQSGNCNGGGINNNSGTNLTVYNSTLAGNTAGFGGGILNYGTLLLVNTTIAFNSVSSPSTVVGGGLHNSGGSSKLRNTLVAGNTNSGNPRDVQGAVTSHGNNLVGSTAGSSGFSQASNDILNPAGGAGISPLANNGGTTETVAIAGASPAMNAGNNCVRDQSCAADNLTNSLTTDQRLNNRHGVIDIGAFEIAAIPTSATVTLSGRIVTPDGGGLQNARVTLTDAQGNSRTILSGIRGAFGFKDVEAGATYIVSVQARRYVFAPEVIFVSEDFDGLVLTAIGQNGGILQP